MAAVPLLLFHDGGGAAAKKVANPDQPTNLGLRRIPWVVSQKIGIPFFPTFEEKDGAGLLRRHRR